MMLVTAAGTSGNMKRKTCTKVKEARAGVGTTSRVWRTRRQLCCSAKGNILLRARPALPGKNGTKKSDTNDLAMRGTAAAVAVSLLIASFPFSNSINAFAAEELTPAARLAERKRLLQERVNKAASRGSPSSMPATPEPPVDPSPSKEREAANTADMPLPDTSNETMSAPAPAPAPAPVPAPAPAPPPAAPVAPPSPPPRSSFEEKTPFELREERKRLLMEKLDKEAQKGSSTPAPITTPTAATETMPSLSIGSSPQYSEQKSSGIPLVLVQLFLLALPIGAFFIPEDIQRVLGKHWAMIDKALLKVGAATDEKLDQ